MLSARLLFCIDLYLSANILYSVDEINFFYSTEYCSRLREAGRLTEYQSQILMERFQANPYLRKEEKCQLAESLNITKEKIKVWFDYRRSKAKTKSLLSKGEFVLSTVELVLER